MAAVFKRRSKYPRVVKIIRFHGWTVFIWSPLNRSSWTSRRRHWVKEMFYAWNGPNGRGPITMRKFSWLMIDSVWHNPERYR